MTSILSAALVIFGLSAAPRPPVSAAPAVVGERPGLVRELDRGLPLRPSGVERALWASGRLVGARYLLSPLGEGAGPDPDPRFRLDAFDCVTLVETAIALGNASSVEEARRLLDDVRYHGPPDFDRRNHYVEAQWLPSNLRRGWIEEATARIAGPTAVPARKTLTSSTWRAAERAGRVIRGLAPERRPMGQVEIPMVPLDRLAAVAPRIPAGTLLLVVREDRPWRPYRVTHVGLLVAGARGERLVRHASDAPGAMRVRDEPLDRFLARLARQGRWPVSGVSLYALRDNADRAREILAR